MLYPQYFLYYPLLRAYSTCFKEARILKESVQKFVNVYGSMHLCRIVFHKVKSSQRVSTYRMHLLLSSTALKAIAHYFHVEEVMILRIRYDGLITLVFSNSALQFKGIV